MEVSNGARSRAGGPNGDPQEREIMVFHLHRKCIIEFEFRNRVLG